MGIRTKDNWPRGFPRTEFENAAKHQHKSFISTVCENDDIVLSEKCGLRTFRNDCLVEIELLSIQSKKIRL